MHPYSNGDRAQKRRWERPSTSRKTEEGRSDGGCTLGGGSDAEFFPCGNEVVKAFTVELGLGRPRREGGVSFWASSVVRS